MYVSTVISSLMMFASNSEPSCLITLSTSYRCSRSSALTTSPMCISEFFMPVRTAIMSRKLGFSTESIITQVSKVYLTMHRIQLSEY